MENSSAELTELLDRFDSMPEKDKQIILGLLPESTANQLIGLTSDSEDADKAEQETEEADERYAQYSPLLRRRIQTAGPVKGRGLLPGYTVTEKTHSTLMEILTDKENTEVESGKNKSASGMSLAQKIAAFIFSEAR